MTKSLHTVAREISDEYLKRGGRCHNFWACPGPNGKQRDMMTCWQCAAIKRLRRAIGLTENGRETGSRE